MAPPAIYGTRFWSGRSDPREKERGWISKLDRGPPREPGADLVSRVRVRKGPPNDGSVRV
jgi:hypothetical protein